MRDLRSSEAQDWREGRRLRAWELKQAGWKQRDIAAALGVTAGAVSQWISRAKADGVAALRHRTAAGPTPRLSAEQRAELPALLARGPEAWGFRGEVWTQARVALVIERAFGVRYHPDHVGRILKGIGWSLQKPVERASQRDEAKIAQWRAERWPALKRGR